MTTCSTDLIGTTEAAKILGLTREGVRKRIISGALTPHSTIGTRGINVFDRAEIEALAEREVSA